MSWIFIVLAHWNNCSRIDMSLNTDTLFWFRVNQFLLFLLNAACLAEKQQIPIFIVFSLTRPWLKPTSYRTQSGHASHYPTYAVWIRMVMKSIYLFFTRQWYRCRIIHVKCEMQYFVIMITPARVLFEQETDNAWINVCDIRSLTKI